MKKKFLSVLEKIYTTIILVSYLSTIEKKYSLVVKNKKKKKKKKKKKIILIEIYFLVIINILFNNEI